MKSADSDKTRIIEAMTLVDNLDEVTRKALYIALMFLEAKKTVEEH